MNKRLDSLIEDVKEIYDYIVIDTAPVGAVSDTYLIDRLADITLYVCRAGYSDKRNLEFLNHIIADGNLSRAYLIINDLDMSSRNYYYHRGYSYGYGNSYGHEKAK
jgi:tyrosine-protein kinase Etk/Wzc